MTLVTTQQLYGLIDAIHNLLNSIKIIPSLSIAQAISLLAWIGTAWIIANRGVDAMRG